MLFFSYHLTFEKDVSVCFPISSSFQGMGKRLDSLLKITGSYRVSFVWFVFFTTFYINEQVPEIKRKIKYMWV